MAKVTGFGGAFVRAADPVALTAWYKQHLGMPGAHGFFAFPAATQRAKIAVTFFKREDTYFPPCTTRHAQLPGR